MNPIDVTLTSIATAEQHEVESMERNFSNAASFPLRSMVFMR